MISSLSNPHRMAPEGISLAAASTADSGTDRHTGAMKSTRSAYSAATSSPTGGSLLQTGHHSAQKIRYAGLSVSESVQTSPRCTSTEQSGASSRSWAIVATVVVAGMVVLVVAGPESDGEGVVVGAGPPVPEVQAARSTATTSALLMRPGYRRFSLELMQQSECAKNPDPVSHDCR